MAQPYAAWQDLLAYQSGQSARRRRLDRSANPHWWFTRARRIWFEGFDAEAQRAEQIMAEFRRARGQQ